MVISYTVLTTIFPESNISFLHGANLKKNSSWNGGTSQGEIVSKTFSYNTTILVATTKGKQKCLYSNNKWKFSGEQTHTSIMT